LGPDLLGPDLFGPEPFDLGPRELGPDDEGPTTVLVDEDLDFDDDVCSTTVGLRRVHLQLDLWNSACSRSHLSLIRLLIAESQNDLGELLGLEARELGIVAGSLDPRELGP